MQARSARGTDDVDNEWVTQVASGPMSHTAHPPDTPMHATAQNSSGPHEELKKKSVLTIISDQAMTEKVESFLEANDVGQYVVDLNISEELDSLVDEASWQAKFEKLKAIAVADLTAVVLIHPARTFTSSYRSPQDDHYGKRDLHQQAVKNVRLET